jgi:hypothetical protein
VVASRAGARTVYLYAISLVRKGAAPEVLSLARAEYLPAQHEARHFLNQFLGEFRSFNVYRLCVVIIMFLFTVPTRIARFMS